MDAQKVISMAKRMRKKIFATKSILLMFAIVFAFAVTISCTKSVEYYVKQVDDFVDTGYPKPKRVSGVLVSNVEHKVVDGTAIIENTSEESLSRWWVDVKCDYWAGCFMRCDGSKQQCRNLAEDSNFTVNSISPF